MISPWPAHGSATRLPTGARIAGKGLIVAPTQTISRALGQLIDGCPWPLVTPAALSELRAALVQLGPDRILFWLDDAQQVEAAVERLAWLRALDPTVLRIVVAYRLAAEVELDIRAAGGQVFVAADGEIVTLLEAWLPTWLRIDGHRRPVPGAGPRAGLADAMPRAGPALRLGPPP